MKLRNVEPERILAVVQAVSFDFCDFESVCQFCFDLPYGKIAKGDRNHTSRAITSAAQLSMLQITGESVTSATFSLLSPDGFSPQTWDAREQVLFFRSKLQAFEPFLTYYDFVTKGFSHASAASKASTKLGISPVLTGDNNVLRRWGAFSDIFGQDGSVRESTQENPLQRDDAFLQALLSGLDNALMCRNFLREWLGSSAYEFIQEDIKKDLTEALLNYSSDAKKSTDASGKALEDFLKQIAASQKVSLVNQHGKPLQTIGSIIQKLRQEKILADHHTTSLLGLEVFVSQDVFQGLNAFRKMQAHGTNLEAGERWSLSSEIAITLVLQVILAVRSVHHYVVNQKLRY